jgi:hypothetical protein
MIIELNRMSSFIRGGHLSDVIFHAVVRVTYLVLLLSLVLWLMM